MIPFFTFNRPQNADHTAPAAAAAIRQSGTVIIAGSGQNIPITVAARLPTTNWPSAPMLNTPVRKEKATLRPVKIKGVA